MHRYGLGLVLLGIIAVGSWGYYHWQQQRQSVPLSSVTVTRTDIEDTITALGNLQPRDYVDVGAQVSGQLKVLKVAIGDRVEKGQLLAEVDATVQITRVEAAQAQLKVLRAQLAQQQVELRLARQQLQRQQNLQRQQATTTEALETARAKQATITAQIQSLKAQIQAAESTLKGDQATLSYAKIYAPMTGTIVSLTAKQGQTLNANQTAPIILRIADLSTMTVWTQVSEADVSKLRLQMPVYFTTLGGKKRWYGQLEHILPTPEVVNNVVLYTGLFSVVNAEQQLMTQMTAQVFFVRAAAQQVLTLPLNALSDLTENTAQVQQWMADGSLQKKIVTIGVRNRVLVEIKSGLQENDQVIVAETSPAQNSSKSKAVSNSAASRPRLRGL